MRSLRRFDSFRKGNRIDTGDYRVYSSDKLCRRLNEVLKDVYNNLDSALDKLQIMLPVKIYLKNLISLFTYLKIPFTVDELKTFISSHTETSKNYLTFDKFSQVLIEIESKKSPSSIDKNLALVSEGTSTCNILPVTSPMHKIIKEKFKSLLHYSLTEKFENFVEAFQFATSQKTITYFGFIKLMKFLQIPADEVLVSEYFNSISKNGHLTLAKFKSIWFNKEGLCAVTQCSNAVETFSDFCSVHFDQFRSKGKQEFNRIMSDLDLKSQIYLKSLLKKNPFPDVKSLKETFNGFKIRERSKDCWKSIATYINTKEPDLRTYTPITKLRHSTNSCSNLQTSKRNRLRHRSIKKIVLKVVSYSNDTVVVKSSFE